MSTAMWEAGTASRLEAWGPAGRLRTNRDKWPCTNKGLERTNTQTKRSWTRKQWALWIYSIVMTDEPLTGSVLKRSERGELFAGIASWLCMFIWTDIKSSEEHEKEVWVSTPLKDMPSSLAKNFCSFLPDTGGFCVLDSHQLRIWALFQSTLEERKKVNTKNFQCWLIPGFVI